MMFRRLGPTRMPLNPFSELETLRRDMQRWLDNFEGEGVPRGVGVFPAMNVSEDAEVYRVRAELPGVKSSDLDITALHRTLTVSGRRTAPEEEGVSYHRRERQEGEFSRSITLPTGFDSSRVDASFRNGVLEIILPKPDEAKPRRIQVRAS
jgi:HSP20 family protein